MLIGEGANGKSVYLNLLTTFLGEANVSHISLQGLNERFGQASLHDKLANIHADLPTYEMRNVGYFLQLTCGDWIGADRKFRERIQNRNYAKLLFSCNRFPRTENDTHAYGRRWVIIPFPNTFTGQAEKPNILRELTSLTELSGLLNKAIEALQRITEKNGLSNPLTQQEINELISRLSNPVKAFLLDETQEAEGEYVLKETFAAAYIQYAIRRRLTKMPERMITVEMKKLGYQECRPREDEKRFNAWANLRPKAPQRQL